METSEIIAWCIVVVLTLVLISLVGVYFRQPARFGIRYRPATNDVKRLAKLIQSHIDQSQQEMVAGVTMLITLYSSMAIPAESAAAYCVAVSDAQLSNIPGLTPTHKAFLKELNATIIQLTCVNGKFDKNKAIYLLESIRNSLNI